MQERKLAGPWLWIGVALFLLWLAYSLSAYYVVQKPFSAAILARLAGTQAIWLRWTFSAAAVVRSLLDVATPRHCLRRYVS